ncbi:hypothetical protein [Candidatus Albibeggiatoa sp. nov. NOAA]|uniref:hypothetical protein n=1 Tax=Candidatus Albibeggiatoa sp. nov. NOAA TaxID=3162724 RepID=UPI0032F90EA0|nr:hypothetical protein [Thiotrichaceae bacterium]
MMRMVNSPSKNKTIVLLFLFAIFTVILIRTAWLSDDALITFKTVINFTSGYGLVFNLGERVQAYTHTLWFFVLSFFYYFIGNIYYTTFLVSITTSMLAVYLLANRIAIHFTSTLWVFVLLLFSSAFIDFSTSGLENPMSFLLISVYFMCFVKLQNDEYRKGLTLLVFVFSLLFLNRPDIILIGLPLLIYATFKSFIVNQSIIKLLFQYALGLILLLAWEIFSIFYYGFPLPNTAYAKLGTGIQQSELYYQGLSYFLDSIQYDPITLIVIFAALALSFARKHTVQILLSLGIILYLLYILKIGGDFMSGRFFAVPFFTALIILSLIKFQNNHIFLVVLSISIVVGFSSIQINGSSILRGEIYHSEVDPNSFIRKNTGIADERKFYHLKGYGFLTAKEGHFEQKINNYEDTYVHLNSILQVCGGLGEYSMTNKLDVYILDTCALSDPLLSRLPIKNIHHWRAGHFQRAVPDGYRESIFTNENLIEKPELKLLYDDIRLITRGDLFDRQRLITIAKINLGL